MFIPTNFWSAPGDDGGALTFYFEENLTPAETVAGTPVTERADFMARLSGTTAETFESYSVGNTSVASTLNGTTCTIKRLVVQINGGFTDTEEVELDPDIDDDTANDRFNTTSGGSKWLDLTVQTGSDGFWPSGLWEDRSIVRFAFSTAIAAFGFYGTDWGDFATGQDIQIRLTDSDANVTTHTVVSSDVDRPGGALIFWGFVDSTGTTYTKVEILIDQADGVSPLEGLGVDDLVFCTPAYLA